MQSLEVGREISEYTGVIINVGQGQNGENITYSAGDNTGYVLEVDNPIGTPEMAASILEVLRLRGAKYQPYKAGGTLLNPAAEIGDFVTVNGKVGMILEIDTNHSKAMFSSLSAPYDEEVDHAFQYQPKTVRQFKRESSYVRSRLTLNADSIEAKVSKTGGDNASFGWTLTNTDWSIYSNGSRVLRATADGLEITGKVTATSGSIGGCDIVNGVLTIASANISSINADVITAGTLSVARIANGSINGGEYGKIASGGITGWNCTAGINTNLGYAAGYGAATVNGTTTYPSYFKAGSITAEASLNAPTAFSFKGYTIKVKHITISGTMYNLLGYD